MLLSSCVLTSAISASRVAIVWSLSLRAPTLSSTLGGGEGVVAQGGRAGLLCSSPYVEGHEAPLAMEHYVLSIASIKGRQP